MIEAEAKERPLILYGEQTKLTVENMSFSCWKLSHFPEFIRSAAKVKKASAMANSEEDFAIAYYDSGEDVLYEGLEQNNKFFGEVLKDDDLMRRFLGLYVHDVYETLRDAGR